MAKSRYEILTALVDDDINSIIQLAIQNNRAEIDAWLVPIFMDLYERTSSTTELEEQYNSRFE